jgi:hypothetical protein
MISNLFRIKLLLLALLPLAAWAATATTAPVDPLEQITFWQWARVIMFTLFGWAIQDLDKIAELRNPAFTSAYEKWREILKLWKGIFASLGAGIATFFIAEIAPAMFLPMLGLKTADGSVPEIPDMFVLLLCAGAGWEGARWWTRFEQKRAAAL